MDQATTRVRTYQPADFDKYVLLLAEAEKLEPSGRCVSPQFIAEQLARPNYSPEQDLFILWGEDIVGYMDVKPELAIGRVILDCWVHPEYRRRGLAVKLLDCATNRVRKLGAGLAHVNVREDNIVATRVLSRLGFSFVRRFLELRRDIVDVSDPALNLLSAGRYLQPGEEAELTQLQNRAFEGTWGYNPNTVEEIAFQTKLSTCSPEDVLLTFEGDKAVGYCWTGVSCEEGVPSARKGRILMLGVAPDYRGRGIGKRLVLAGLGRLKNKGLQVAELTVDSENKAACALYQSLGFEVQANSLWYEKAIT